MTLFTNDPWPLTIARTRDRGVTTWTILKAHLSISVFDLVFSGFATLLKTIPGRGRRWVPVKQSEEVEWVLQLRTEPCPHD